MKGMILSQIAFLLLPLSNLAFGAQSFQASSRPWLKYYKCVEVEVFLSVVLTSLQTAPSKCSFFSDQ